MVDKPITEVRGAGICTCGNYFHVDRVQRSVKYSCYARVEIMTPLFGFAKKIIQFVLFVGSKQFCLPFGMGAFDDYYAELVCPLIFLVSKYYARI